VKATLDAKGKIMNWPFDQERNVATVTTKQVMKQNYPILSVAHYSDDHSWAFTCGTTNNSEDLMLVGMGEVVDLNDTLFEIADLPPGWCADRQSEGGGWNRYRDESI
jgi:hypothetical protein